jgi:hypothetical protein
LYLRRQYLQVVGGECGLPWDQPAVRLGLLWQGWQHQVPLLLLVLLLVQKS